MQKKWVQNVHKLFLCSVHVLGLKCLICSTVKFCDEEGFIFVSKKILCLARSKLGYSLLVWWISCSKVSVWKPFVQVYAVPKGDSSKFLSKTANSFSQSVLFNLSHLVKQVTADENLLVFISVPNKVIGSLCCFRVQSRQSVSVLQTSAILRGQ